MPFKKGLVIVAALIPLSALATPQFNWDFQTYYSHAPSQPASLTTQQLASINQLDAYYPLTMTSPNGAGLTSAEMDEVNAMPAYFALSRNQITGVLTGRGIVVDDEASPAQPDLSKPASFNGDFVAKLERLTDLYARASTAQAPTLVQVYSDIIEHFLDQNYLPGGQNPPWMNNGYIWRDHGWKTLRMLNTLSADKHDLYALSLAYISRFNELMSADVNSSTDYYHCYYQTAHLALAQMSDTPAKWQMMQLIRRGLDISITGIDETHPKAPLVPMDGSIIHHDGFQNRYASYSYMEMLTAHLNWTAAGFTTSYTPNTIDRLRKGALAWCFITPGNLVLPMHERMDMAFQSANPLVNSGNNGDGPGFAAQAARLTSAYYGTPMANDLEMAYAAVSLKGAGSTALPVEWRSITLPSSIDRNSPLYTASLQGHYSHTTNGDSIQRGLGDWYATIKGQQPFWRGGESHAGVGYLDHFNAKALDGSLFLISTGKDGRKPNEQDSGYRYEGWDYYYHPNVTCADGAPEDLLYWKTFAFFGGTANPMGSANLRESGVWMAQMNNAAPCRKSAFFLGNRIVLVTTDAIGRNLHTALIQNAHNAPQSEPLVADGTALTVDGDWTLSRGGNHKLYDPQGNGYFVHPNASTPQMRIRRGVQSWIYALASQYLGPGVAPSYTYASDFIANMSLFAPTTANYSRVWFDHGASADGQQLEYTVLVKPQPGDLDAYASAMADPSTAPVVITKTSKGHYFQDRATGTCAAAVFDASESIDRNSLLSVSRPGAYIWRRDNDLLRLSVSSADLDNSAPFAVTLAGNWTVDSSEDTYSVSATQSGGNTIVSLSYREAYPQRVVLRSQSATTWASLAASADIATPYTQFSVDLSTAGIGTAPTYTLVGGNGLFAISGSQLVATRPLTAADAGLQSVSIQVTENSTLLGSIGVNVTITNNGFAAATVDSDGDGFRDAFEAANGTNPTDPASKPATALAAYWDFNQSGAPYDVISGAVGTLMNGAALSADGTGHGGGSGNRALDLGSSGNAYLVATQLANWNQAAMGNKLTVSFWQMRNGATLDPMFSFFATSPLSTLQRGISATTPWSDNMLYFDCGGTAAANRASISYGGPALTQWNHFAFVRDGDTAQIWLNGVLIKSETGKEALNTDLTKLFLGSGIDGATALKGKLDDFAMFSTALTAQQIGALASGTSPLSINAIANQAPVITTNSLSIPENSLGGTVVGTLAATDSDGPGPITWSIDGTALSNVFSINANTGVISVVANAAINYEARSSYPLTVVARDAAGASTSKQIQIAVSDVNEAPVATGFSTTVYDNIAVGTVIGSVTSTDPDANQTRAWSITAGNTGGAFAVDANSGVITLAQPLNYATTPSYALTLRATDNGGLYGEATVNISLFSMQGATVDSDGDGYSDSFERSRMSDPNNAASVPNTILAAYWSFDQSGSPSTFSDLVRALAGQPFSGAVLSAGGTGHTGAASDRALDLGNSGSGPRMEVNNVAWLNQLAASDKITVSFWEKLNSSSLFAMYSFYGVSPSSSGTRGISSHSPWTDNNIYFDCGGTATANRTSVSASGTTWTNWNHIALVKNGSTTQIWRNGVLLKTDTGKAALKTDFTQLILGATTSGGSAMRGKIDDFAVFKAALDSQQIGSLASGTSPLNVDIPPYYSPTFAFSTYNAGPVPEDAAAGTVVITPAATDADPGDTITYAITGGNTGNAFSINSSTGQIMVAGPLNFEAIPAFVLTVTATDAGGHTGSATVNVTIGDVNEAPTVTAASTSVAENIAIGTSLLTLSASDPDSGDSPSFSITAGNVGGVFAINSQTGEITTAGALNYEAQPSYSLAVTVTDDGGLTNTATVTITVTNVNEAPTWVNSVIIKANAAPNSAYTGSLAGDASDPDAGDTLTISKLSGPAWLSVASNGALSGTPSNANGGVNTFMVRVTDAAGATADATLQISVVSDGTWINASGGSWITSTNWSGGLICIGTDKTADFSTLNLAANATVTLDGPRTIGNLTFGDTTPSHNWTLNAGTGGPLTLDVSTGTPTITVNNQTTTLGLALAGTKGFAKAGTGTLVLSGANTYTGVTTANGGTVNVQGDQSAANGGWSIAPSTSATVNFQSGSTVRVASGKSISTNGGGTISGALTAAGVVINDGSLTVTRSGLTINSGGDWTQNGSLTIQSGSATSFSGAVAVNTGGKFTYSGSASIPLNPSVNSAGGANLTIAGGTFVTGKGFTVGTTTGTATANITLSTAGSFKLSADIPTLVTAPGPDFNFALGSGGGKIDTNGYSTTIDKIVSGAGSLTKNGAGTLTLAGANTYTGGTTVNAGTLNVNGSLAAGAVTVASGAMLGGTGTIAGAVTVPSGSTLAPGAGGIGTLTVNNTLSLAGTTAMEISKSGSTLTSDQVSGVSTLTYGGTLTVNSLAGTLTAGDAFTLFSATSYSGSFSTINLPQLPAGLYWNTSNLATNGSISVVGQTLTSITVAPASASLSSHGTQQFSATAYDQFSNPMLAQPSFTWSNSSSGSINASGLYTGSYATGSATVQAASGSVTGTANVTVTNAAPTVAAVASGSPATVTGTTTVLSALGADTDGGGESNLSYTWSATSIPAGATAPTYSSNGTNAAKSTTATFSSSGAYTFRVTITDAGGLATTSSVNVTVNQTLAAISVSPATATVSSLGTQQFAATSTDQFGSTMSTAITWSCAGSGSIDSAGLYTAPVSSGSATVTATSGTVNGSASVTVTNAAPTVATAASALPSTVVGTTTNLSVLGADSDGGGEPNLTYTWAATTMPAGAMAPTYSSNGTNAAKNTTVTLSTLGAYTFTVTITDAGGLTATSSVNVTVTNASSGTWTNASGGSWPSVANWSGNVIGTGADSTADFSTLDLTTNATVALDGSRTIGNLIFGDSTPSHNWTLNAGTGGPLTLDVSSGTPAITVNNQTTTLGLVLAGTKGLTKGGAGTLVLSGANTYTGGTTVSAGTLNVQGDQSLANGGWTLSNTSIVNFQSGSTVAGPSTKSITVGSAGQQAALSVSGAVTNAGALAIGANNAGKGSTLNINSGANWAQTGGFTINVPSATSFTTSFNLNIGGQFSYAGATNIALNPNTGTGALNFSIAGGTFATAKGFTFANAAGNTNMTLSSGGVLKLSADIPSLVSATGTNYSIQMGSGGGVIDTNGFSTSLDKVVSGTGSLTKNGAGTLTLAGANTYTGATTVNAGTLLMNGSLATSAMTVASGGTLGGTGTTAGAVAVQAGGILAPGAGGIGTMTINNTLGLAGTATMEVSKSGASVTADKISGVSTITYGGALTVTNVGPDALAAGNSFQLFSATSYSGSFSSITLPTLDAGLLWDVSSLSVNGTISVRALPVAVNDSVTTAEDSAATIGVLANDTDADGDPLAIQSVTQGAHGAVAISGTNVTYTPAANWNGSDSFTYTITDNRDGTSTATVNVTVTPVNDAPVFTVNPITGAGATEDSAYSGTIAGTAADVDAGDTLTFSKVSGPAWLSVAANGALAGTPSNGDVGTNGFTVRVTDAAGASALATLNINVANVNDAPTFTSNPISKSNATVGTSYSSSIAGNATDIDAGETLTFSKVSGPAWLTVASNGTLSGTPGSGNIGANSFTVRVTDVGGLYADATLNITILGSLPSGWTGTDIGAVGVPGSATESGGTYTVSGSGSDIWDTSDSFQFVSQTLIGDGEIRARITSQTRVDGWDKAGVMIRETTAANSAHALMLIAPDYGFNFQYRATTGGTSSGVAGPALNAAPNNWVRLTRSGNLFTAYASADGSTWTQVGTATISMASSVSVGLAVTSHNNSVAGTATFDNVSVTPFPAPWSTADIGTTGLAGSAEYFNSAYTVKGAGVFGGTADSFRYAYQTLSGDGSIVARVSALQNTGNNARVGVMIRDSLATNAIMTALTVNGSGAWRWERRSSTGGNVSTTNSSSGIAPNLWVKLVRSGNTVTSYRSTNGTTWTSIGSITMTMASNCYIGLAVASGSTTTLNTAVIDNVTVVP